MRSRLTSGGAQLVENVKRRFNVEHSEELLHSMLMGNLGER